MPPEQSTTMEVMQSLEHSKALAKAKWIVSQFHSSAVPYLLFIGIGALLARWSPYFVRDEFTVKDQPPSVLLTYLFFGIAIVANLLYKPQAKAGKNLRLILALFGLYWASQFVLTLFHGDGYNFTAFLLPVALIMIWLKPPSRKDSLSTITILGLILLLILTATYILEVTNTVNPLPTPVGLNNWESERYWLPLDGFLGVDGRWVGPFGHNTRAAMAATFVTVIGFSKLTRVSWLLIPGGVYFLLISGVRAGFLATLAALAVVILFSNFRPIRSLSLWTKIAFLLAGVAFIALLFARSGAGTTGRDTIWLAFLELFPEGPTFGVGQTGMLTGGDITRASMDAHNLFLDPLIRYGLFGFAIFVMLMAVMTYQSLRAAKFQVVSPAAILTAYVVASMTDIQNDWLHTGYQLTFVLLAITMAASASDEVKEDSMDHSGEIHIRHKFN